MVAHPHRQWMSVEEYLTLDNASTEQRYEYVDGYAYMLAGGTANHATIGMNVTSVLRGLLRGGPCRVYSSDLRVRLSERLYAYPDATVSCNERDRGQIDIIHYPRLIVEVLSPGTEAYDRGQKFEYYRECPTIQEYVLVNAQRQMVETFRHSKNTLWTFHPFGPGSTIELANLNVSFPIAALYEDVEFSTTDTP